MSRRKPEVLGRYRIVRRIARGGMADVSLARLEGPGGFARQVVVKRILPEHAKDRTFVDMFLDEARIAASIRHPNVVHVEDLGLDDGEPYLVMEYLAGETVASILARTRQRGERIDLGLAIHVVRELLSGLAAAHELVTPETPLPGGIVHRDVSPQNVMVTEDGHVKLLDFGIAHAEGRLSRTSTGIVKGKIAYMSPEQCRGDDLDARSDLFSAGILLHELATLRHPFRRDDEEATLLALLTGDRIPLGPELGRFGPELARILDRVLATDRAHRYASAFDMRRDLTRLARDLEDDDPMETVLARRLAHLFPERQDATVDPPSPLRPDARETIPESDTGLPASGAVAPGRDPAPASPRRAGRYALHDRLGVGGMAEVFYGTLSTTEGITRTVAIKKLHSRLVSDVEARTILLDEARMVARVQHPNVVSLLDVVTDDDDLFLVLEYVHGETVAALLRNHPGGVTPELAVGIVVGALEGLHAAHVATDASGGSLGIVHRDVSPQNVIVGADGLARVLDFGIAKAEGRAQQATRTGLVKGKLAYMAPEQLRTGIAAVRSDVFAAALVLWELVVGAPLFDGASDNAVRAQVLAGVIPRLGERAPVPHALDAVVARALDRDPAARFPSAAAFAAALEQAVTPATPRKIAGFVELRAAEILATRAAQIRRFASGSVDVASVGSAPASAKPIALARSAVLDTGIEPTERRFASLLDAAPPPAPRRRRTFEVAAAVAAMLALGAAGFVLSRGGDDPARAVGSDAVRGVEVPSSASEVPVATAPAKAHDTSSAETPPPVSATAAASSVPASTSVRTDRVAFAPPRITPRAPASPALSPSPASAPSCRLVQQTDARGIVTFERVCR